MKRLSGFRALVGVLLVGSVALAQQGLIVEPWRRVVPSAAAPVPAVRALPDSGLGQVRGAVAVSASRLQPVSAPLAPAVSKWSPPVVDLLVDPWARGQVAAPVMRPRWVPSSVEIVDPWADHATSEPPSVASRPAGTPHSTIF